MKMYFFIYKLYDKKRVNITVSTLIQQTESL